MAGIRSFDVPALVERYGCRCFVEAGTGTGRNLTAAIAHPFRQLVSVEEDAMRADRARARFQPDQRVTIVTGPGDAAFEQILPALPADEPALVWIDARLPGGDVTFPLSGPHQQEEARARLERELRAIARHRPAGADVVLIDELGLYGAAAGGPAIALAEAVLGATHSLACVAVDGGALALLPRGRGGPGPVLAPGPAMAEAPAWQQLERPDGVHPDLDRDDGTPGLLNLIDGAPQRVLDAVCFTGLRGALLKQRFPGARVVGIEPSPAAADRAASRLDLVACTDLDRADFAALGIAPGSLDVILLADALERSANPWQLLVRLRGLLRTGGCILARIPNVRNLAVLESLAKGNWTYQGGGAGGPLDIQALRHFTHRDVRRLFQQTGYKIDKFVSNQDAAGVQLMQSHKDETQSTVRIPGVLTLHDLSYVDLVELATANFLVSAVAVDC